MCGASGTVLPLLAIPCPLYLLWFFLPSWVYLKGALIGTDAHCARLSNLNLAID